MGSEEMKPRNTHKPLNVFLTVFTVIFYVFVVAVNYMSSTPAGQESGLFLNSTGDVSDLHYLEITPAGWTFTIWLVIYLWQLLWMVYALVGLFRKSPLGGPLYAHPELLPPVFYVLYLFNLGCNLAWMLLFDRMYIDWCLIPIALLPFTLYCCLAIVNVRLNRHGNYMQKAICLRKDIWFTRFFVHNGLGIYATWTTIACLLNLAMVLTYRAGLDQSLSSTISLSILMVELSAWFILDLFVFERYTRYLFTPYLVVCFALSGSLVKNYDPTKNNSIATVVLAAVACLALVIKVIMSLYRHCTRPIFTVQDDEDDKEAENTQL